MKKSMFKEIEKVFVLLIAIVLFSCSSKGTGGNSFDDKYKFDEDEFYNSFRQLITSNDSAITKLSTDPQYFDTLKVFYSLRENKPFWFINLENKNVVDSIISLLEKAYEHGIDPHTYDVELLKNNFSSFLNASTEDKSRYSYLANTELLLSNAVLRYAYHLRFGVVNPKEIFDEKYALPTIEASDKEIFTPFMKEDIIAYLNSIQPKQKRYLKLQQELKTFTELSRQQWEKIPSITGKIKLKDKSQILNSISEKLIALGYLKQEQITMPVEYYDSTLFKAVSVFQRSTGLIDDGAIGKETIDKLNIPPAERLETIKINLERFRWTHYEDTLRYILVNIPDFHVYAIEENKPAFRIRICTGKKRSISIEEQIKLLKKKGTLKDLQNDWETPQLYGKISHLILNPTWTVPTSIIREEIYSEAMKDSNYLRKKNFKVFKGGKQVNVDEVNLRQYSRNHVPYTFVQNSGPGNALGRIKFMFTNDFGVYLHDTPTRPPFSQPNRAVSHGCMRVEKPFVLAEYIMKNNCKWTPDYIRIETGYAVQDKSVNTEYQRIRNELRKGNSYGNTTEVKLDKPIPLFVDYFTAWVDYDGFMNFRDDVYSKDKIIKKYLFPLTMSSK